MNNTAETPTTAQIIEQATALGTLVSQHPATVAYQETVKKLEADLDAQRLMNDYNRQLQTLGEKESKGEPIEVEDKKKIGDLQSQIALNPILSKMQLVQMDYIDLMRKVESAMSMAASAGITSGEPPVDVVQG